MPVNAFTFQGPVISSAPGVASGQAFVQQRRQRQEDQRMNAFRQTLAESTDETGTIRPETAFSLARERNLMPEMIQYAQAQVDTALKRAQVMKAMQPKFGTPIAALVEGKETFVRPGEEGGFYGLEGQRLTGDVKPRPQPLSDWQKPGWMEAQQQLAVAKGEGRLSPTAQKELFEADETIQSAGNAVDLLNRAKLINKKAYSGPLAKERIVASRVLPGTYEGADAATDLDNIVTGQALESLRAIFGGMPTEGERKILIELQGSLEKTPEQREAIFNRAIEMADRRKKFNTEKAKNLREGSYFKKPMTEQVPTSPADVGQSNGPTLPKIGTIEYGYAFIGGNPSDKKNWKRVK